MSDASTHSHSTTSHSTGPSWRWIVGVLASLLLILLGAMIGGVAGRLGSAERDLRAQGERMGRQDTRIEIQNYRIAADSMLIQDFRREMRASLEELKNLLRGRARTP